MSRFFLGVALTLLAEFIFVMVNRPFYLHMAKPDDHAMQIKGYMIEFTGLNQ